MILLLKLLWWFLADEEEFLFEQSFGLEFLLKHTIYMLAGYDMIIEYLYTIYIYQVKVKNYLPCLLTNHSCVLGIKHILVRTVKCFIDCYS